MKRVKRVVRVGEGDAVGERQDRRKRMQPEKRKREELKEG